MKRRAISRRLAALFAAIAFALFSAIGIGVYFAMRWEMRVQLRAELDARAEIARLIIQPQDRIDKWPLVQERLSVLDPLDGRSRIFVTSNDARVQYGKPIDGTEMPAQDPRFRLVRPAGESDELLVKSFAVPRNGERPDVMVVIGQDRSRALAVMRILIVALTSLIGLASIVALMVSGWATRVGLRPLVRLSHEAANLNAVQRNLRLDTASLPHELLELADAFNGALQRLDRAYLQLEAFNADVAHELRTPVSIMIGETEVALSRRNAPDSWLAALESNREELERIRVMISDMLFVSRADSGELAERQPVESLAGEARKTLDFLAILFEDAGLSVALQGDAACDVNDSMLGRALTNLLTNAIKHAHAGTRVDVTITPLPKEDAVELCVSNVGDPIEPSKQSRLFDRFYRGDEARTNSHQNHGLGLAIVEAIAKMHGGHAFYRAMSDGRNAFGFTLGSCGRAVGVAERLARESVRIGAAG
jgi:two-component system, OmpR family, heavy metal sensor histidine kinase CusS